jgi:hypothetical protein
MRITNENITKKIIISVKKPQKTRAEYRIIICNLYQQNIFFFNG